MINNSDILEGTYNNIDSDGFLSSTSLYRDGKLVSCKTFIKQGNFPKFNIQNSIISLHTYESGYLTSITYYDNGQILYKCFYDNTKICTKIIDKDNNILYELTRFNGKIYENFKFTNPPTYLTLIDGQPVDKCIYCYNNKIDMKIKLNNEYDSKYYKKYNFDANIINYKIERNDIIKNTFNIINNNINYNYKVECSYFNNKLNGIYRDYKNNQLFSTRNYVNGMLNGNYTEYNDKNIVVLSIFYEKDIIHGSIHRYYTSSYKAFYFNTINSQSNDELKIHSHEIYDKGKLIEFINYNVNNEHESIILNQYINNKMNYFNLNITSSNELISQIIKNKSLFVHSINNYEYYNIEHCFHLDKNVVIVNKYSNIFGFHKDTYSIKIMDLDQKTLYTENLYKNDKLYKEIYPTNTLIGLPW